MDGPTIARCRLRSHAPPSAWGFALCRANPDDDPDNVLPSGWPADTPEQALDWAATLYLSIDWPTTETRPTNDDDDDDHERGSTERSSKSSSTRTSPPRWVVNHGFTYRARSAGFGVDAQNGVLGDEEPPFGRGTSSPAAALVGPAAHRTRGPSD